MHELAITRNILDIALECAQEQGATRIGRINLVVGQMTGVVEDCVRLYMSLLTPGTVAEGVEVAVRLVPITVRCQECEEDFEVRDSVWTCPRCQGAELHIVGGRELFVESIEVNDGSQGTQGHS